MPSPPPSSPLDEAGWKRLHAIVEEALGARPPAMRRQLRLFLRVLSWLPLLRYGRRFTGLDPERRRAVLRTLQDAPVLKLRQGIWGLRTLVYMGYYGQPEIQHELGYRAHLDGWRARAGGPDPEHTEPVGVPLETRPPPPERTS